jgi:hypothetical protein
VSVFITVAVSWERFAGANPLQDLRQAWWEARGELLAWDGPVQFLMRPSTLRLFRRGMRQLYPYWLMPGIRGEPLPPIRSNPRVPPKTVWLCRGETIIICLRV